jgi:PAS domain S-box-containing protein
MAAIFRTAPSGIGVVTDRVFTKVNKTLCSMVGYTEKELLGENSILIYPTLAEYEKVGKNKYKQIDEKGTGTVETIWKKKDGRNIDILLSSTPIDKEDYSAGVIFTALDITPQKNAARDKKYLEERLARSQKMEALGLLAGGVAHDLNNVLSGIVSYPELLLLDIDANKPLYKSIKIIQDSGKKAEAIVQDLLTLARRGVTQREVLNVNSIIKDYLRSPEYQLMSSHYPQVVTSTQLEPKLLYIQGSAIHLKKTLMNLVNNAAEAILSHGTITISTYNRYVDRPIKGYDEINEGDFVVLSVHDDGSGIRKEDLQHLFEPFYTKKVMGRCGTGLGMSVVWGTIQDHSGYINIDTEIGKGTTFELFFPITREPLEIESKDIELEQYLGNSETILLVDDDKNQHVIAGEMLSRLGYNVESVGSGEEAIEYLRDNTVDLVLLDMIMDPGIDGLETYRRIIEINPQQKTIIASGFSETKRLKEAQRLGAGQYVKKPYTLEHIGLAVKQELSDV